MFNNKIKYFSGLCLFLFLLAPFLSAQSLLIDNKISIGELLRSGGSLMYVLYFFSIVALGLIIERFIALRKKNILPPDIFAKIHFLSSTGALTLERCGHLCQESSSPFTRVLTSGLKRAAESRAEIDRSIEEACEKEIRNLNKWVRPLNIIGNTATLVGLLGTVFGMIEAFHVVSITKEALGKTELLAGGIYKALVTTAAGLIIAIPVLIIFALLTTRIDNLIDEVHEIAKDIMREIITK